MVVDNRTPYRSYALPDPANNLSDDVLRLIDAFESVDEDVQGLSDAVADKAEASHTHEISDVNGLQTALDGKAAGSHTHALNDLSDVDTSGAANGQFLKRIGTSWGPAAIQIGDINGLENALNAKAGLQETALIVPSGTTGQRPSAPVGPLIRFNTTLGIFEAWYGSAWGPLTVDPAGFVEKSGDEMQGGLAFKHGVSGTNEWMLSFGFGDKDHASIGVDLYNDGSLEFHAFNANTGAWIARVLRIGIDGFVTLNANPTQAMHAATKQYVDNNALLKSGGTMTGALTLSGNPTSNLHAATKQYVDNAVASVPTSPVGLYTGSSAGATNLPVGHHVIVDTGGYIDRNSSDTVRLAPTGSSGYASSGSGSQLSGTWRARGGFRGGSNGAVYYTLMQRTA